MYRILEGDVMEQLRTLPDESVQCCITSPPYWGLRDYGLPATVWPATGTRHIATPAANDQPPRTPAGTKGLEKPCAHEWVEHLQPAAEGSKLLQGNSAARAGHQGAISATMYAKTSAFCRLCGAWRGALGLEPSPELYVEHIATVFREVRRVLRKDGTLWLNMGDSYAGSWGNYGGQNRGHGKQREIVNGSSAPNPAYDGLESWRPPTAGRPRCGKDCDPKRGAAALGQSFKRNAGLKPKDLVGIPWMVAFALRADGWWLRSDMVWAKPNPMPESVRDRCTKSHEYLFLLSKSQRYYYDRAAIAEAAVMKPQRRLTPRNGKEQGYPPHRRPAGGTDPVTRNKRDVWMIATQSFKGAHFAVFPEKLAEPCILAGTSARGCCPECGAPWKRVSSRNVRFTSGSGKAGNVPKGKYAGTAQALSGDYDIRMGPQTTTGWAPTCKCGEVEQPAGAKAQASSVPSSAPFDCAQCRLLKSCPDTGVSISYSLVPSANARSPYVPVSCTVLDCFAGSGTAGVVALRHGREFIGIELKPEYAAMARRRIENDMPLLNVGSRDVGTDHCSD